MPDTLIKFDYNNLMADRLGGNGVAYPEVEQAGAAVAGAVQWFYTKRNQGKMDFFDLPEKADPVKATLKMAGRMAGKFDDLVVLGIGGSALGTAAVQAALNPFNYNLLGKEGRKGRPRLWVLDNVDPERLKAVQEFLNPKKTLVNVISKSGSTAETSAQFLWMRQWMEKSVGPKWTGHFVVTTDPVEGILRQIVTAEGLPSLEVPPGVGGRFSVLTPVGLFPLAMAGVDVKKLMAGANAMRMKILDDNPWRNPARMYGLLQYLLYQKGCTINVMMPYADSLYLLADWFRQLWAESLGKRTNHKGEIIEVGPTPVKALGATDQHSQLQLYMEGPRNKAVTFLVVEKFRGVVPIPKLYKGIKDLSYLGGHSFGELLNAEATATAMALAKNGRPNCAFILPAINAPVIGELIFLLEVATAFTGGLFGINPMDQPGVEEAKRYTYGMLGKEGFENRAVEVQKYRSGILDKYII